MDPKTPPLLRWLMPLVAFFPLLFPSTGTHGWMHPKSLLLLMALYPTFLYAVRNKKLQQKERNTLALFFYCLALVVFSFLIAVLRLKEEAWPLALDQAKILIATIIAAFLPIYWIEVKGWWTFQGFARTLLWANCLYNFLKLALYLLLLKFSFLANYQVVIQSVQCSMGEGLQRLQTSCDLPTPFLLYILLEQKSFGLGFSPVFSFVYAVCAMLGCFFSFSRALWVTFVVAFILSMLLHSVTRFKQAVAIFFLCISIPCFSLLQKVSEERFFSTASEASDLSRKEQIEGLLHAISDRPLLGSGLGSYVEGHIRDEQHPYNYEVQWLSLALQLGVLPLTCLLALFLFVIREIRKTLSRCDQCSLGTLFSIWLALGWTNPFVLSILSGLMYALFYLIARNKQSVAKKELNNACKAP